MKNVIPLTHSSHQQKITSFIKQYLTDNNNHLKKGIMSIEYMTDSTYVGQLEQSQLEQSKEGKGIYRYSNGDIYLGQWKNDQFHGYGVYLFGNGQSFEGFFENNQSINGTYTYLNGNKYKGQFKNSMKNGYGIFIYNDSLKSIYEGYWQNGQKKGQGKYFNRQLQLTSQWKDNIPCGKVIIKGNNFQFSGYIYDWMLIEGQITIQYSPESFFKGDIKNNIKQGNGIYQFNKNCYYEGQFKNDNFEGKGILKHYNGIYEGEFKNNLKSGYGTYKYNNQDFYSGYWLDDKKNGHGKLQYGNGDIFEGIFVNDIKNGKGIYKHIKNGNIYSFYEGNFYNDDRHGIGKHEQYNFRYEGQFSNNIMHGNGILNGNKVVMLNNQVIKQF